MLRPVIACDKAGVVDRTGDDRAIIFGALLWMPKSSTAKTASAHERYGPIKAKRGSRLVTQADRRQTAEMIARFDGQPKRQFT